MSEQRIRIECQLSEAEYLVAARLLFFQSREVTVRMVVFCVLALLGTLLMNMIVADMGMLWPLIGAVILFEGFLFYNVLVLMPRRHYRGDPKFREKYDLTFSDEGVMVKTFQIDSKLAWSL